MYSCSDSMCLLIMPSDSNDWFILFSSLEWHNSKIDDVIAVLLKLCCALIVPTVKEKRLSKGNCHVTRKHA
jgi:hypothetical protein